MSATIGPGSMSVPTGTVVHSVAATEARAE